MDAAAGNWVLIAALIGTIPGISALILGILNYRQSARKDIVVALQADNDKLRLENDRLWKRNGLLQEEIDELRVWVVELQNQIHKLGQVPVAPKNSINKAAE